ncbi:hypothetical protein LMG31506_03608 [Cupriavidus yeoncheonensis]|uniref:Integral membrane bound transporter domain-containing protein n=1 Tax=Cupriavidus yeoncheonensis TaxID=1462994 RepID=A0A916IVL9_9BURK|nr:FUSC family protein [Cupriavidus yeoncheonensis]CAG2147371.1 hypothetical protein LMG31506_03608 [Cupriavidus yeoncheonensis]
MAQPAADKLRLGLADIGALLAPVSGRAAAATRVTVSSTLTVLVTSLYGTPEAAISAYVIFFFNRADRTTSIIMSVAALILVSLIIGIVMWLAGFTIDDPMRRVACMAVLSAAVLFLTSASKLRPVGAIVAMISGFGLDELGLAPAGELATRGLLYAWLMVAIPIGVNVVVNLLIGPSPRRLATDRLAHGLRLAARCLRETPGDERDADALHTALHGGVQTVATWLKLARLEGTLNAQDLRALQQAMASTMAVLLAVDVTRRQAVAQLPAATAAPIAARLDEMARMLDAGGYPVEVGLEVPPLDPLTPVQQTVVRELVAAINRFAEVDETAPPAAAESARSGFLAADAFTNPAHVRYALKTTGAAMFCYLLYQQLNWPGIHTCFITCYLVSLGTMAETMEKLSLRLAGCMVGAAIGTAALVYVVPALSSIGGLMLLVFAGTWISAWVAQGSPRIAYAGFQIAFAFYLCVIQGPSPDFDLTISRDRVIGVMLGNLVVYLVFARLWPVSIAGRVESALAALVSQWQALIDAPQASARRQHAAAALALHGTITQDLILAHYEPSSVGPAHEWVHSHRERLARLDAISGPMFLLAERFPGDPALAQRLSRLRTPDMPAPDMRAPDAPAAGATPPDTVEAQARDGLLAIIDHQLETSDTDVPDMATPSSIHAQT